MVCPLCNGFLSLQLNCPHCSSKLIDFGKVTDYFDDYSPYMEIDDIKLTDGYKETTSQQYCPHLLKCLHCEIETVHLIKENF